MSYIEKIENDVAALEYVVEERIMEGWGLSDIAEGEGELDRAMKDIYDSIGYLEDDFLDKTLWG